MLYFCCTVNRVDKEQADFFLCNSEDKIHFRRTATSAGIFTRLDPLILSNTARNFQGLVVPCFTLTPQFVLFRNQT